MVEGWFTWPAFYSYMVKRFPSCSSFVEVGLLRGASFIYLIEEVIKSGKEINITGVDHFAGISDGLLDTFLLNTSRYHDRFRLIVDKSVSASLEFDDKSVDMVYIDAAHDYESVMADTRAWLPKIKHGGVIAGHDYPAYPGVVQAVDELFGDRVNKSYIHEGCWMINI